MCYYHIRDNGEVIATVSYQYDEDEKTVFYGVSIVSESEPRCRISLKKGRDKAESRMQQVFNRMSDMGYLGDINVSWKKYNSKKKKEGSKRVNFIKSRGFDKLGSCSVRAFKRRIQKIKNELSN